MLIMKNKPLIIGAIVAVALLIIGAIYFFVINGSDSEVSTNVNTPNNTQEENGNQEENNQENNTQEENGTDTDPDTSTEDDGSAVLVAKGFDCQTTTVVAEAQAQIDKAQTVATEDPSQLVFAQSQASLIGESEIANSEVLNCNHAERHIDVLVASSADADVYMGIRIQAVCTISADQGITAEGLEVYIQNIKAVFEADPAFVINSKVYFATSSASAPATQTLSAQKQLGSLLEEAEAIEYTSYALPDGLACAT